MIKLIRQILPNKTTWCLPLVLSLPEVQLDQERQLLHFLPSPLEVHHFPVDLDGHHYPLVLAVLEVPAHQAHPFSGEI